MSDLDDPVPADAPLPPGIDDDALAQALVWLSRHHGQERSAASLFEGQHLDGPVGPDQALRALRDAGWASLVVWECELRDDAALKRKLATFLR